MASLRATVLVFLALLVLATAERSLEIQTKCGKVRGVTKTTFDGKEVDTFLGIPYGAPPTGMNRFGPPKEAEPWSGILDATSHPRPCYQVVDPQIRNTSFVSPLQETEDCLKLNIWVPKRQTEKSAVMFWIYGGSFAFGSIDLPFYDGSILAAQENVIVVSANYRLSAFGFLYLGHPLAPGNAGLMDQALGMQWVKKNIEAFGGDPQRVTIFGESAGGGSVGLQLLAPSSTDLFENAVLQSGNGVSFWSAFKPEEALAISSSFAVLAGCPVQESKVEESLKCLQEINRDRLHSVLMDFENDTVKMNFKPVVDGDFLPTDPSELLEQGKFGRDKNVLIGYTKGDGAGHLSLSKLEIKEDSVYSEEQIRQAMKHLLKIKQNLTEFQTDLVKYIYTDWNNLEDRFAARSLLVQCVTDRWFACGAIKTANEMADRGNSVFLYRFDQIPTKDAFQELPRWMGSSHASDIPFVFGLVTKHTEKELAEEAKLSKQVMRYWANFARNGNPQDDFLPTWPVYSSTERWLMKLDGGSLTAEKNDRNRECAFWENIFPKTEPSYKNEL